MTRKLIVLVALSFALSACETSPAESNSNTNAAKPAATTQATPAPNISAEPSPAAKADFKAGDKVKVTANGSSAEATIVSVDEKAGKATVRVLGEKQDKTVALAEIARQ